MFGFIMFFSLSLVILAVLYATNRTGEKPNGNFLLGVSLPLYALKDESVIQVQKKYHQKQVRILLLFLLLLLPYLYLGTYISLSIAYCTIWCILLFYLNQRLANKHFHILYLLKKQNGWRSGSRHIIRIDTEVSRLKNSFVVSKVWFIIPFLISMLSAFVLWLRKSRDLALWSTSLNGIIIVLLCFFLYLGYLHSKSVVYSQKTELNLAINQLSKREWSRCWVLIALLQSIIFMVLTVMMLAPGRDPFYMITFITVADIITIYPMINAFRKVRREKNLLLQAEQEVVYVDEDQYWERGYYYNPNDNRLMVEKRWGYGLTTNMAKAGGKVSILMILLSIALAVWLAFYLAPLDFGSVSVVAEGKKITVQAPMETYSFSSADVVGISLIEDFPDWSKRKGGDSERFLVGLFDVSGYGRSRVYIHRRSAPYIVIELKDGWIFLNGESPDQTEEFKSYLERELD